MNESSAELATYRFAVIGASGTITLKTDRVQSRMRTSLGWWEQTVPLEHLVPNYATQIATPPYYVLGSLFGILGAWLGIYEIIWGVAIFPQKLVGASILVVCAWAMWNLYRHRNTEWIIFPTATGYCVRYARMGPDEKRCDEFTRQLIEAINKARRPQEEAEREGSASP